MSLDRSGGAEVELEGWRSWPSRSSGKREEVVVREEVEAAVDERWRSRV